MPTMIPTSEISKGTILEMNGSLFAVLEYERFKAGKGNSEARMRVKMRDLSSGFTKEQVFRTDDRVPKAEVESRPFQYLYNEGDLYTFMDKISFEQKSIADDVVGDAKYYLIDGLEVEMLVYNDRPVSVQLPINVDVKIVETEPGFKGDTATGGTKKATTDTGLTIDVPLFLNPGDVIRVDTRSGQYIARV